MAHPQGELHARASEGVDLVGLAPHNEIDLAAAWKLSRVLRQYSPGVVHAHDPHAVAMAGTALSFVVLTPAPPLVASRRVDFHLSSNSFSRWKYRQVTRFIAASEAIRDILVQDGIPAGQVTVVHDGIDVGRVQRLPSLDLHVEYWLPHGVPVIVNVGGRSGDAKASSPPTPPVGDGAAVVVRGRESRPHGEGRQVNRMASRGGTCDA